MRRLEAKVAALGWAYRYRILLRQGAEQQAMEKAAAAADAKVALSEAEQERLAAADAWARVMVESERLDPILGQIWKAEYDRRTEIEGEALSTRKAADEQLRTAAKQFQQALVIADQSQQDFNCGKRKLGRMTDELCLFEVADLLTARRVVR